MRLTNLATLVAAAMATFTGVAAAACPVPVTSQPFAPWGDDAPYALAPGGSFEGSLSWQTRGLVTLVDENDPFALAGRGTTSVRLKGRQSITSPVICVSANEPFMRFVTRARDASSRSRLVVEALFTDNGQYREEVLDEHPAEQWERWAPSKIVPLGEALPTGGGEVHDVRLRFKLKDGIGDWLVDDVFIDPMKRG